MTNMEKLLRVVINRTSAATINATSCIGHPIDSGKILPELCELVGNLETALNSARTLQTEAGRERTSRLDKAVASC